MESNSLWLVRHGQASFGKSDYDNLSDLGHEQAFLLGRDLTRRGIVPSLVVSGSMRRHRQTLAEIAAGAGWTLTEEPEDIESDQPKKAKKAATVESADGVEISAQHAPPLIRRRLDERWNELDHTALLTAYKPAYKNMLLLKADMVRTLRPRIAFEDTFEKAVDRWTSGEHDEDYPETFRQFSSRIGDALADFSELDERLVLVVTSAGPVCWSAAHLSAAGSIDAWKHFTLAAVNTGVTRVMFDRHGPRVLTFNEFGHLDGPGHVTNR